MVYEESGVRAFLFGHDGAGKWDAGFEMDGLAGGMDYRMVTKVAGLCEK